MQLEGRRRARVLGRLAPLPAARPAECAAGHVGPELAGSGAGAARLTAVLAAAVSMPALELAARQPLLHALGVERLVVLQRPALLAGLAVELAEVVELLGQLHR